MNNAFLPVRVPLSLVQSCIPFSAELGADRVLAATLYVVLDNMRRFDEMTWMHYWLNYKRVPLPDFEDAGNEVMLRLPMRRSQLKALRTRAGVWCCSTDHPLSWFAWWVMTQGKAQSKG